MSEPPESTSEFSELWRSVSKICYSKVEDKKPGRQMPGDKQSPLRRDLQSPQRKGYGKFHGLNNGDSPSDVEPTQDIFWDPTSPTPANTGFRSPRIVEISDIVNRIAPKDVKWKGTESPLLQWIGDSAVSCTPDIPKPRMRKRSTRQSSVEDLMKLARQFDENMQQDRETSDELNRVNSNLNETVNTSEATLKETPFSTNVKDSKCLSSSAQVEAELNALFDCSTQNISGRLSQGSSASSSTQEVKKQPGIPAEPQKSEQKVSDKSDPAAKPAEAKGPTGVSDDFDDDWENDDLLNDSFVLAVTQNPNKLLNASPKTIVQCDTKTDTTQFTSVRNYTEATSSEHQPLNIQSKPSCSALQELCPKLKTTNRSTFKLEPNPHFLAGKEESKSNLTAIQSKSKMSNENLVATKAQMCPQPAKIINDHKSPPVISSVNNISDSLWDDQEDDALLLQMCDNVETISSSQPQQGIFQKKQDMSLDRQRKTTTPLPIHTTGSANTGAKAHKKSPSSFVRSNSLPGASCQAESYQGWDVPMKGVKNKAGMSQSLPGGRMSLGTFSNSMGSNGTCQTGNYNQDMRPLTVTAGQNSKSHHTAFKRTVSDSAVVNKKVFVTSQMTGKCSAAEIERKKQEALARRRLRMQSTQKP
ncbi:uncharacterized protein etaa1b [Halichoeres trimaculatus]|uniref:uncharacterized protein etaa1b n=1 Tax=Halichoeres trimaculatus TaxID=147232 RepID=UPI003D9DF0C9